ncbi:hypothetical protein AAG570_008813 [Ranatra chinensis]|uniref:Nucleoporin Nup54 alpha-helical domain-containing protein n=1 Tax=Ranatra chinensis TaxID=642074 RepID=A0ABD0YS12_9HEMI
MPPVDYTPQNPLCRFKAIVYSMKPTVESKEGIVALQFNKKEEEIRSQESQLIQSLTAVLGNRPNLAVKVDAIKPASDSSALVFVYVEEKVANGLTRRVPNTELSNYFLQQTPKMQLTQMGAVDMYPYCSPDKAQIQEYLETTPAGIDPRLWKQAQLDNPDCEKYIPVPLLGFNEVRWRYHCQMLETKRHQAFLDGIADEIAVLQRDNETTRLKILEYMHKAAELEHRVLKVLVRQAITRNIGVSLRPEEEVLRSQLETIQSQLNSQEFKGRLSELVSQVKIHKQEASQQDSDSYTMTPSIQDEIKEVMLSVIFLTVV